VPLPSDAGFFISLVRIHIGAPYAVNWNAAFALATHEAALPWDAWHVTIKFVLFGLLLYPLAII
jgi:hypothetical protein